MTIFLPSADPRTLCLLLLYLNFRTQTPINSEFFTSHGTDLQSHQILFEEKSSQKFYGRSPNQFSKMQLTAISETSELKPVSSVSGSLIPSPGRTRPFPSPTRLIWEVTLESDHLWLGEGSWQVDKSWNFWVISSFTPPSPTSEVLSPSVRTFSTKITGLKSETVDPVYLWIIWLTSELTTKHIR